MSDQGHGGTVPEDQYVGEYQAPAVPETPQGAYSQADVDQIDQAYEKDK